MNSAKNYIVICRADTAPDGTKGEYVCATHRLFDAEQAAAYAMTVARSREPRIVTTAEYLQVCERFRENDSLRRQLVDVEVPLG